MNTCCLPGVVLAVLSSYIAVCDLSGWGILREMRLALTMSTAVSVKVETIGGDFFTTSAGCPYRAGNTTTNLKISSVLRWMWYPDMFM